MFRIILKRVRIRIVCRWKQLNRAEKQCTQWNIKILHFHVCPVHFCICIRFLGKLCILLLSRPLVYRWSAAFLRRFVVPLVPSASYAWSGVRLSCKGNIIPCYRHRGFPLRFMKYSEVGISFFTSIYTPRASVYTSNRSLTGHFLPDDTLHLDN